MPPWARWVVMAEAVNRAQWAAATFRREYAAEYPAYRQWADSFGVDSPGEAYGGRGDDVALRLESLSKWLVAGEALSVRSPPPTRDHLRDLLRA
eukprot:gene4396-49046_t